MSNKPKGVKRLTKYIETAGERRHKGLLKTAKAFAIKQFGFSKHQGSKPNRVLALMREKY